MHEKGHVFGRPLQKLSDLEATYEHSELKMLNDFLDRICSKSTFLEKKSSLKNFCIAKGILNIQ